MYSSTYVVRKRCRSRYHRLHFLDEPSVGEGSWYETLTTGHSTREGRPGRVCIEDGCISDQSTAVSVEHWRCLPARARDLEHSYLVRMPEINISWELEQ